MDLKRIYVKYGGVIRTILYCKNRFSESIFIHWREKIKSAV